MGEHATPLGNLAESWLVSEDHGSHDKLVEWWYFTGDTYTGEGQRFGYEFTIFKTLFFGVETFTGHIAITDAGNKAHYFQEKIETSSNITPNGTLKLSADSLDLSIDLESCFHLKAATETIGMDIVVTPTCPPLLNGVDGIVEMPDGNSSYYYSFTNADSSGTLTVNGESYKVEGRSWMDHQWGDFRASGSTWDWFSIRFEDGGALMLSYSGDNSGHLTYRDCDGEILRTSDYEIKELSSSRDFEDENAIYRLGWQIVVKELDLDIIVDPIFDAQSFYGDIIKSYWEGLCDVTGTFKGENVTASAYVELTGYDKE